MSKQISLSDAQKKYVQTLNALDNKPDTWPAVLLVRDQVDAALLNERNSLALSTIEQINELDKRLRGKLTGIPQEKMVIWRDIIHPPDSAWWWWEDKRTAEHTQQKNLWWEILTGTILALSSPLIFDIIKRFWDSAPDTISIFGTLLTLLLTASPLVKEGRLVVQWILKSAHWLKVQYHAKTRALMSLVVFLILLLVQQWILPYPLATYYNNQGAKAQTVGNLASAQQSFQRAAALNPDRVVPYYNIARGYEQSGIIKKAEEWYQKAIEQDAEFVPAYRGLGQIYNDQGKFMESEKVLIAGLAIDSVGMDQVTSEVTHYELLANLGWSYFAQGKLGLAEETLSRAVALEDKVKIFGETRGIEYRLALPHFYLAQIYEQAGDFPNAIKQWEESLRFLDQADWRQRERYLVAQQHLQDLTRK